jgi:hypothetical protein
MRAAVMSALDGTLLELECAPLTTAVHGVGPEMRLRMNRNQAMRRCFTIHDWIKDRETAWPDKERAMKTHDPNERITRNLFEAIERVRQDVTQVEFWASAVTGFSQPVPSYDQDRMMVWMPKEQAAPLKR